MNIKTTIVNTPTGEVKLIIKYNQYPLSFSLINLGVQYPDIEYNYNNKNILNLINNFYCIHKIRRCNCKNCPNFIYNNSVGLCIHNLYRNQCNDCKLIRQIDDSFIFDIFYYLVINYNLREYPRIITIIDDINKCNHKYDNFMTHIKQHNILINIEVDEIIYNKTEIIKIISKSVYGCKFDILIRHLIIKYIIDNKIQITNKNIKSIIELIKNNIKNNIISSVLDTLNLYVDNNSHVSSFYINNIYTDIENNENFKYTKDEIFNLYNNIEFNNDEDFII